MSTTAKVIANIYVALSFRYSQVQFDDKQRNFMSKTWDSAQDQLLAGYPYTNEDFGNNQRLAQYVKGSGSC